MDIESVEKNEKIPPFEEISLPDRMLEMALADLESSRILYQYGYYPQVVFLLQQSVEKTCKSLGIFFSIITEKESSSRIRHNSLNIVTKTTDDFAVSVRNVCQNLTDHPELIPAFSHLDIDIQGTVQIIDAQIQNVSQYLKSLDDYNLTNEQITQILADLEKQTGAAEKSLTKFMKEGMTDEEYQEVANKLFELLRSIVNSMNIPEQFKSVMIGLLPLTMTYLMPKKEQFVYLLSVILTLAVASISLFHLARLTAPHAVCSRYPSTKDSFDPLDFYSTECPLVKRMPDIFNYAQTAIERVDLLYDLMSQESFQPS
jgi:hypothetical protein